MRSTIAISILGSLALCLLVAGCGGGGDSAEAQEIDKATFVQKAETICKQVSGRLLAEVTALAAKPTPESNIAREQEQLRITFVKTAFIPGLNTELKEIRALGLPAEGEKEVQAFVDALQQVVKKAEADPVAFSKEEGPYERVELSGRRYGVIGCPITQVGGS